MYFLSRILGIIAAMLIGTSASAIDTVSSLDRLDLWTGCEKIYVAVDLDANAARIVRSKEIHSAVLSRLRAARLFPIDTIMRSSPIYVNVVVLNELFSISIDFEKDLQDDVAGWPGIPKLEFTWRIITNGIHGEDPNHILSSVSRLTDQFIDEYLRLNEDACSFRQKQSKK